ncbi:hypothetical protein DO021_12790 [Desulfobacter hydrogenophilus]|uniref:DUF354 domain-containing protein n=1 Tax=Desulfobacter hydrogenophilus TaxID=2291 RepID=A0A328FAR8_9BACT|nr:DUF354 domain-containing protein [Desulfobacter hydrogenophilus]NDY74109.1 DUF354 domain-containing protein [Desulfobacter hydrogenophilus]QBH14087.1 DUF354 domain-containing protein [Desulfobacter hydrogenophilus]RAM01648.1 hypothetical protein DO021_12790 [Desulfobacter hydrogenophilus]
MNIAFFIAHPSQYYLFKESAAQLCKKHNIILIYFEKDMISDLIKNDPYNVKTYCIKTIASNNISGTVLNLLKKEFNLYKIAKDHNIELFVGTSVAIAHVGRLLGAKSIIFTEDDVDVTHLSAKIGYPFCNHIVSPAICNLGKWEKKGVKYQGYQKLSYLHPTKFQYLNNFNINEMNFDEKFFLLRFSNLSAHHDIGIGGITDELAKKIIEILSIKGRVYISSERQLTTHFEKYKLKIDPTKIHQVLARANLLISDSQSMSVEAAMLGVPSIRFSDFSGRISVLEELEHKYCLTFGIKTSESEKLLETINELLSISSDLSAIFQTRRDIMLKDKIDVSSFITKLIDTYPRSINSLG